MKVGDIVECALPGLDRGIPGAVEVGIIVRAYDGRQLSFDVLTRKGVGRWWMNNLKVLGDKCEKET